MNFAPDQRTKVKPNKKGITTLNLVVILGFVILVAVFLIQNNNLLEKNYELRRYEKQITEQEALSKKLEIRLTEIGSLSNLQEMAKNFNLVAVDKIKYLEGVQTSMALSPHLE